MSVCCPPGNDAASALVIRNDSEQVIWIDEDPGDTTDERIRVAAGEQTLIPTFECASKRIEAQDQDGESIVVLDEKWCATTRGRQRVASAVASRA